MVFKYPVVFEGGADNRPIRNRELLGRIFKPNAGVGKDRCAGYGVLDVLKNLRVGLAARRQARNAQGIGPMVENRYQASARR